jgi:hypothetical protein
VKANVLFYDHRVASEKEAVDLRVPRERVFSYNSCIVGHSDALRVYPIAVCRGEDPQLGTRRTGELKTPLRGQPLDVEKRGLKSAPLPGGK